MKKIFNIFSLLMVTLLGLSLAACSEKDEFGTNQYQGGVHLNVFGPSPVMRGGQLRFLGSNLDQIKEVQIPGVASITNIEVVKSGVPSEIRVTVPKDGPTPGKVKLITNTGVEIETQTPLAYKEPIEIESVTASAMPGDVIEIKGDYLNLIHMVEFADGVWVSEKAFTEHTRYVIKVKVPEDARTGKLGLYDMDLTDIAGSESDVTYNIIKTETAINIGTPTVSKVASPRGEVAANGTVVAKKGETITITGKNFNLTDYVMFANDTKIVEIGELEISKDGTTITLPLPAEAPDGDITIVCKSGIDIPVGTLQTVKPTELVATPAPVKNGQELTITGKDLDVITSVLFPAEFEGTSAIVVEPSATSLKVVVPETATEGDITLYMANGSSVTVAYTLVKPTVTAYSSNPVSAGGALTITGTNLDLVSGVTFNGSAERVDVESDGTTINLSVPMDAQSGAVTLKLKNGTDVTVMDIQIEEAVFCYAEALPGVDDEIHAGETFTLVVKNIDKLTGVQINGIDCQYITSGDKLIIGVPETAKKGSKVRLISSNGEITYTIDFIPNTEVSTVLFTGILTADDWTNQPYALSDAGLELAEAGAVAGDVVVFHISPMEDAWKLQIVEGHWGDTYASICSVGNDTEGGKFTEMDLSATKGNFYLELTQEMLDKAMVQQWWGGTFVLNGDNVVVDKITLIHYNSVEETLWEGEAVADDWGNQPYMLSDAGLELAAVGAKVGQIIRFYITPMEANWNLQVVEGHWSGVQYCDYNQDNWDLAAHKGAIEIEVTQAMLDAAYIQQWWGGTFILNGDNVICTKITIE